jgi:hypothetical protein
MVSTIFFVLAAICFGTGAVRVAASIDWLCAGDRIGVCRGCVEVGNGEDS